MLRHRREQLVALLTITSLGQLGSLFNSPRRKLNVQVCSFSRRPGESHAYVLRCPPYWIQSVAGQAVLGRLNTGNNH